MADIYSLLGSDAHNNPVTGCIIWTGDLDRNRQPVANLLGARTRVRDLVVKANGGEVKRGMQVETTCENDRCIRLDHFRVIEAEQPEKPEVQVDPGTLEQLKVWSSEGRKQEWIAEQLGTTRSRVAKMFKVLREDSDEDR